MTGPSIVDCYVASTLSYSIDHGADKNLPAHYDLVLSFGPDRGFRVFAIRNKITRHILVAFRGTTTTMQTIISDGYDAWNDLQILRSANVDQYEQGVQFLGVVASAYPGLAIYVTGHSLGAGIAQYVYNAAPRNVAGGYTFAGPGNVKFQQSAGAVLVDLVNRNDPVGGFQLAHHAGRLEEIDSKYHSFQVETYLNMPKRRHFGFNSVPNPVSRISQDNKQAWEIIKSDFSFLLARVAVFHLLDNYGRLINRMSPDPRLPQGPPAGIQQLAQMFMRIRSTLQVVDVGGVGMIVALPIISDTAAAVVGTAVVIDATLRMKKFVEITIKHSVETLDQGLSKRDNVMPVFPLLLVP